jgi:hypothetical protein
LACLFVIPRALITHFFAKGNHLGNVLLDCHAPEILNGLSFGARGGNHEAEW